MIQLQFTHLLYDIEQQTHALAEARMTDNLDLKAEAQIDQSNHLSDIAMRFCESGCALLNTWLKDKLITTPPSAETTETNKLTYDNKVWNFNTTITSPDEHTLATLFHRFVVAYVLWQWAKLFSPNEVDAMHKQMLSVQKEIENAIYELGTPTKRQCGCHCNPDIKIDWTEEITLETEP